MASHDDHPRPRIGRSSLVHPPDHLEDFPSHHLESTQSLVRIHRADRQVGFYSSDGSGRFDLAAPLGTCYLGEDPLASFVEVFREVAIVAETLVATKALSWLRPRRLWRLADVTNPLSRRFGVTGEIHTTTDYELTQAWAQGFAQAGFDGVRYRVRHDPAQQLVGVALFGPSGLHDDAFVLEQRSSIPVAVVDAAWDRFGIEVLPT